MPTASVKTKGMRAAEARPIEPLEVYWPREPNRRRQATIAQDLGASKGTLNCWMLQLGLPWR